MSDEKLLTECVQYFKERSIYQRLFEKFREKYISLGHLGGSVILQNLSLEDKRNLGGFFQKDYTAAKSVTISASRMEKALSDSRFSELQWQKIIETYFGEPMQARKEQMQQEEEAKNSYFESMMSIYQDSFMGEWLRSSFQEKRFGYQQLIQQYHSDCDNLSELLRQLSQVSSHLPCINSHQNKELLPVYAAKITGNPHALDEGTDLERMLWNFLQWYFKTEYPARAEYKSRVYYEAGLLKDALSNDVLVYGLHGILESRSLHPGMEGFVQSQEIMKLTLQTIGRLSFVRSEERQVYMVENPAVFAYLVEKYPNQSFICGYGQLKLAAWVLLDKLTSDTGIYYMGDFDPEGLQIAENLKKRYGERLNLWHYDEKLYKKYLSDIVLSESRLQKLQSVQSAELQEVKMMMKRYQRAAYQEAMIEEIMIVNI